MIYAEHLRKGKDWPQAEVSKGKWVLARPYSGPFIHRLKLAWKVLTGECDALKWEKQ